VMTAMFLSAKIGFFAILPNVVPIVIFFGVMGWLGIYLNPGTSLIAAIALGIAVDSTIHYMARLNLELRGETDQAAATVRRVRTVGAATIPLFADLRPAQARIVVLMGDLRHFAPGETIVRRGEIGEEMYVMIGGRTEVFVGDGAGRQRINELKRGDVFGEMGLVRHAERTADVVAA